ncbi:EAP30/Vps36 family-domain-containing protein [Cokeromyces recurvatus]|uniref:EAP30/Vps36 family-domain-containing protein n=1 Tax=Cokeromyces recurvatus TaxID=90255 RepID=UPI0022206A67|nr:EAP30/Vps36 family-domain-containing protein [Cokeromyces recurvatus]KAI7906773.1 EAP30/Vps36 family-domain-containing protein [Cokeromyces recurvatus]
MEYFKPTLLSASHRPELISNESLLIQQVHIGLYEGKHKLDQYQDGVCYLTTHRIIYVDYSRPLEYSIELSLSVIQDVENYNGFLRSSPKIILNLNPASLNNQASLVNTTPSANVWACPICFFSNKASTDICELCGVRKQQQQQQQQQQQLISTPTNEDQDSSVCTLCTFKNHPSMVQCEMCGADLPKVIVPSPSIPNNSSIIPVQIRLSFRHGGHSSFLSKLKQALSTKQWEKKEMKSPNSSRSTTPVIRGVGISAIEDRIKKTSLEANETMTNAFQDLDKLMMKATEMVKLAESISNKLSKDSDNKEMSTLRTHLLNLGVTSPVTKGTAGSIYHQELARELADFLGKLYEKEDEVKSLTDIYCLFNRARGVELISPEDLHKASQQFESLKLPFRLRKFPSGLLVIQSIHMDDNIAANRILKHVKEHGGLLTALQLADIENLALAVAEEQLFVTERMGLLCRDEGPAGLTFYENLFLVSSS